MDKDKIWETLMGFGAKMGCHQRADRSFFCGNYQFPLCARCTGIFLTSIWGYVLYFTKRPKMLIGILLVVPMMADGIVQLLRIKESSNLRRLLTGMLGGPGLIFIRLNFYQKVAKIVIGFYRRSFVN